MRGKSGIGCGFSVLMIRIFLLGWTINGTMGAISFFCLFLLFGRFIFSPPWNLVDGEREQSTLNVWGGFLHRGLTL